jgi:hypothetical protein
MKKSNRIEEEGATKHPVTQAPHQSRASARRLKAHTSNAHSERLPIQAFKIALAIDTVPLDVDAGLVAAAKVYVLRNPKLRNVSALVSNLLRAEMKKHAAALKTETALIETMRKRLAKARQTLRIDTTERVPIPVQLTIEVAMALAKLGVPELIILGSDVHGAPDKVAALYMVTPKEKRMIEARAMQHKMTTCAYTAQACLALAKKATLTPADFERIALAMRTCAKGKAVRE